MKKLIWPVLLVGTVLLIIYSFLIGTPLEIHLATRWEIALPRVLFLLGSFLLNTLFSLTGSYVVLFGSVSLFLGALMNLLEFFFAFPSFFYTVKLIFYVAGSLLLLIGIFRVFLKLKRFTLMFRGLFEENNDMVIYYDPSGKIVDVNPAAEKFLGYTRIELLGKTIEEISKPGEERVLFQILNFSQNGIKTLERELLSKDGRTVLCECKLAPVYEGKKIAMIQEIARPIDDIRKIEDQIRRERKRFLTYFNNIPVLSVILREDGTVEDVNEAGCKLLGVNREQLLNKNWFDMFHESFPHETFERSFKEKMVHEGTIDGRIIRWVFIPLEENRVMVTGLDITELKENLTSLEEDKKFYQLLLDLSKSLLSPGWNDFVFKQYLLSLGEVFGSKSVALYEKKNGDFVLTASLNGSFEEILSRIPEDIDCENRMLRIPLEYETDTFAVLLIGCGKTDERLFEMARLLKNHLELIYWKLKGEERILWLAERDSLTGVYNREAFESRLAYLINLSKRYSRKLSFVFIDLDDFKRINDSKGHLVGDRVLKEFVNRLTSLLRKSDVVGRLGGDEFGIILPETDRTGAEILMKRIEEHFRESVPVDGELFSVNFSYGISVFPEDGESVEELLKVADERMYMNKFSKKRGRENV
ncbi:PAS/PAC sensor-containing diguanylate cyclase [Thermotoga sp. Cell2]|uniref:sensor domain-containing diguanylate cyclase n=1 Tax=unclassified Thermotoga TaxID=2631113 RepID=UPI000540779D|nr:MULTISPECIES: sensor domain-containing diguanylate cyclase [unclassified Thermotoga]AIY88873.1 PAS/PAC sensor-containing diguanylate cyclase [Thermotoga sp. Cell2]KHC95612.1 PAS/PAC sensor-containing diguanylate cyclase [Thermotoga sp. Xyl54]